MEALTIANKNIKMLFKNVLFIVFLIAVPMFMIYFMKSTTDNTTALMTSGQGQGFVELVVLEKVDNNFFANTFISGILVQFLLMASVLAGAMVVGERENNTLVRMFIAPISRFKMLGGMLIGHSVFVLVVASLIMALSHILFEVNWGSSIINIGIVTLLASYVATSLAFIVSGIFKSGKVAGAVMSIVVIAMTFMSGGIIQGEQFNTISKFTINRWISQAYLGLMNGEAMSHILPNIIILAIMGTVFMVIAAMLYRKENIYE